MTDQDTPSRRDPDAVQALEIRNINDDSDVRSLDEEAVVYARVRDVDLRNLEAVESLGYQDAMLDEDNDVRFMNEGVCLFARTPDSDPSGLIVFAVCEAHAETLGGRVSILEYANNAASKWTGIKVALQDDGSLIVVEEMFVPTGGDISEMIGKAARLVTAVVREYFTEFSPKPQ